MGSSASTFTNSEPYKQTTVMLCSNCSSSLNIFSKKKCTLCLQFYCSKCFNAQHLLSKNSRVCIKCLKLASGKFTRNDLEVYSVKELRLFLGRSHVPLNNCFEKSDLVALVLKTASDCGTIEDMEHRRHVQQLKEKMQQEITSASSSSVLDNQDAVLEDIQRDATGTNDQVDNDTRKSNSENVTLTTNSVSSPINIAPDSDPSQNLISEQGAEVSSNQSPLDENDTPNVSEIEMGHMESRVQFRDPVKLEDIRQVSDVDFLSIRQMKELLTRNFVNYKGCCERKELSSIIINLWKEHSNNQSCENLDKASRDDICKICMDQVIDCVLLECGHMVACKKCSKQLAECPICRKYVSRVVHVFRA